MDRVGSFLREKTPRRAIALATFVGLVVLFRDLLVLLVFFVAFERMLGWSSLLLSRRARIGHKPALLAVVALLLGAAGGSLAVGVGRITRRVEHLRETLPERISALRELPLYQKLHEQLHDADKYVEGAKHYATSAAHYFAALGHLLLYATIGFILAVVFLLEREEMEHFVKGLDPRSLVGTLVRWFGHLAEAVLVTVQLQIVVAACNAALTVPVLFLLGLPHKSALALLIFTTSLVPVIGNFVSGVVLCLFAYQRHGLGGVAVFLVLTFVLHKIEAYYLNPRLTARHVKLPGFVLIVSLLAWEHLLGFVGLFVSFPLLFVATRIHAELRAEEPAVAPGEGPAAVRAP